MRPHKSLLRRILGVLGVAEHAVTDPVDGRLMAPDQLRERLAIAGPCPIHELGVLDLYQVRQFQPQIRYPRRQPRPLHESPQRVGQGTLASEIAGLQL